MWHQPGQQSKSNLERKLLCSLRSKNRKKKSSIPSLKLYRPLETNELFLAVFKQQHEWLAHPPHSSEGGGSKLSFDLPFIFMFSLCLHGLSARTLRSSHIVKNMLLMTNSSAGVNESVFLYTRCDSLFQVSRDRSEAQRYSEWMDGAIGGSKVLVGCEMVTWNVFHIAETMIFCYCVRYCVLFLFCSLG